jgi:hypothetical protein
MKKSLEDLVKNTAETVAECMKKVGYAAVDEFLGDAHVREALEEMKRLSPHYTASEIWVGREDAGAVGAHIHVPSVRGDKVRLFI